MENSNNFQIRRLSSRVKNLSPSLTLSITAKSKKMKEEGIDVVDFGSGEPDFDTPPNVQESAIKAIQEGFTKYTPASGTDELKKVICKKFLKDNNLKYSPSQIVVSCGAKHSIYNIIQSICDNGDEIIVPSPYWLSYPEMVSMAGGKSVFIYKDENDHFKITKEDIKRVISPRTKALILNSPSNPTGCVYTRSELEEIGVVALENNILVISDEIYGKILFDGCQHISIASINKDIFSHTIVVNGVSKSAAMTGWRIGYLACPDVEICDAIKNLQSHSTSNPTSISQSAAIEAIRNPGSFIDRMVTEFESRRDYIVQRIEKIKGLSCLKPEGAFYIFCRIGKENLSSMELTERLLEEARVAVVPGKVFGSDRHIRLSFATSMEDIKKGLDRMEEWFKNTDDKEVKRQK